ncbi:hypothetical protein OESDEN_22786 [Oesophagostomum dentatum]|uniref:WASH complex subunit 7 central domain-containing protein n=1 Tax=Oesophagostomum dentatum TaxID=61180 RepID=A0A0B1RY44_OESDE|nr:hypothetical protein OESDEN_22786 [Oesophagostomum dentatum]
MWLLASHKEDKEASSPLKLSPIWNSNYVRFSRHGILTGSAFRDKSPQEKLDFYKMIMSEPEFRLHGFVLNAADFVTCKLQKTFYDLTAVNLHDRHAYSKMAILAKQRYGLDLVDGCLPNCTVGQSLDVVKVICSLGDFVTDFNYCLNQQVFIEKLSPNRSLRVLTSEHMADSMRTHGLGVLNTSVNITYQVLLPTKRR